MTSAEGLPKLKAAFPTGRPLPLDDIGWLIERVEHLEQRASRAGRAAAAKRRRNAEIARLAAKLCPDMADRPAARRMLALCRAERQGIPALARIALDRIEAAGGLPTTDRQVANIIAKARKRNDREI